MASSRSRASSASFTPIVSACRRSRDKATWLSRNVVGKEKEQE
jgi:hypothetical protein